MSVDIISRHHFVVNDSSEDLGDVRRFLEVAARADRKAGDQRSEWVVVSFSVTFASARVYGRRSQRDVTVSLYRDHGQRANLVLNQVEESGSLHQALRYLVGRRQDVSELGAITRVEMLATPPRPN